MVNLLILCLLVTSACTTLKPSEPGIAVDDLKLTLERMSNNKVYLMFEGHDKDKNCLLSRTEVFVPDGQKKVFQLRLGATTESCKGKNCEHCKFKTSGGCECVNSLNTCEHTIIKTGQFLRWR